MSKNINLIVNISEVASVQDDKAGLRVTLNNGVEFVAASCSSGAGVDKYEDLYNEVSEFKSPDSDPKSDVYKQFILQFNKGGMNRTMKACDEHTLFTMSDKPAVESFLQPKIVGYRQLSQEEVDLMNEGKVIAEQCGEFIAKLRTFTKDAAILNNSGPVLDQRWVSLGATQLQQGFMAVIRGIAQPTTF